jgi:hypothetical protein
MLALAGSRECEESRNFGIEHSGGDGKHSDAVRAIAGLKITREAKC